MKNEKVTNTVVHYSPAVNGPCTGLFVCTAVPDSATAGDKPALQTILIRTSAR